MEKQYLLKGARLGLTKGLAAALLITSVPISGCSWLFGPEGYFRDRSMDYKLAKTAQKTDVVTKSPSRPIEDNRKIPEVGSGRAFIPEDFQDVPRPHVVLKLAPNAEVELHRDNGVDFLLVDRSLSDVRALMQKYWQERGVVIEPYSAKLDSELELSAETFITGWQHGDELKKRGVFGRSFGAMAGLFSKDEWHRFRVYLLPFNEDGRDDTRVIVSHQSIKAKKRPHSTMGDGEQSSWSSITKENKWLSREVMGFGQYIVDQTAGQKSDIDDSDKPAETVLAKDGNGYPILHISQGFAQAWATVGRALKRADLEVNDLNRSLAIYYIDLKEDQRFEDVLFASRGKAAGKADESGTEGMKSSNTVGGKDKTNEDKKGEDDLTSRLLELKLSRTERGIQVSVQIDDETWAPIDVSQRLLSLIKRSIRR